jgi:hypothetical protein
MMSHHEMPQLIDNHILSDVNLNMEVYYSNIQNPNDSNLAPEAYEYIWDNWDEEAIDGKHFIASKYENSSNGYGTPVDVGVVKFGRKWRALLSETEYFSEAFYCYFSGQPIQGVLNLITVTICKSV